MAVTFAVGAVTGTVLSFEFGLLWPRFMGQCGAAFGIPFAFEGLFFFTEAIFIAIYIYGWKRLKPWAHFWTGVPIVIAGIGGSRLGRRRQRLDEPAVGLHAGRGRQGRRRRPARGDLQHGDAARRPPHMLVAAYMVGGFLVASVYAVGMLRGRRDRYHRLGLHHPVHGRGDRHADPDGRRRPARPVGLRQPARQVRGHRAACPRPRPTCPRRCSAICNDDGTVTGGIPIPGWPRWLSDPADGTSTEVQGLDAFPPTTGRRSARPTPSTSPGTSWSGSAPCCSCSSLWYGVELAASGGDMPERAVVPARRVASPACWP